MGGRWAVGLWCLGHETAGAVGGEGEPPATRRDAAHLVRVGVGVRVGVRVGTRG